MRRESRYFFSHDRIAALVVLVFAIGYMVVGNRIETAFDTGVTGPREWGLGVGGLLALCALLLFIRPTDLHLQAENKRALLAMLLLPTGLLIYAQVLLQLGFVISSSVYITLLARIFGGRWLHGLIVAIPLTLACYGLFDLIGISLPSGMLWK